MEAESGERRARAMNATATLIGVGFVAAAALWVGALALLMAVLREGPRLRIDDAVVLEPVRRRCGLVMYWATIVLLALLVLDVLLGAGDGLHALQNGLPLKSLLFESRYGVASVARWVLLLAGLGVAGGWLRAPAALDPRGMAIMINATEPARHHALGFVAASAPRAAARDDWQRLGAALALAVLACTAAAGAYGDDAMSAAVETLRLGTLGIWLGGIVLLVVCVLPFLGLAPRARRPGLLLVLLDRFTLLAVPAVVLALAATWWERTQPLAGATMPPAWSLGVWLALLWVLVAVGVRGALVVRPRLWRLMRLSERQEALRNRLDVALGGLERVLKVSAALAGLTLVASVLATAGTAPSSYASSAPVVHALTAVGTAGGITMRMRLDRDEAGPGKVTVTLHDASGQPLTGATVVTTMQPGAGTVRVGTATTLTEVGSGGYQGRNVQVPGGRWTARVTVRTAMVMAASLFTFTTTGVSSSSLSVLPRGAVDWRPLGPAVLAHTLLVDAAGGGALYEGTSSAGVYRSTDGGAHWTARSTGLPAEVWSMTFLPSHVLLAATEHGVYRSADEGAHWAPSGLGSHAVYSLAIHGAGQLVVLAGCDGGIYRSYDAGLHWTLAYDAGAAAVVSLAWPGVKPTLIVAGVSPGPKVLVLSTDGGATWHAQSSSALLAQVGMMSVAVAPGGAPLYAGTMGQGAYLVSPAGAWSARTDGLPGLDTGDAHIASFAFDGAVLYAATPRGVYKSTDQGRRWTAFGRGLTGDAADVTGLVLIHGTASTTLYATTATGLYRCQILPRR